MKIKIIKESNTLYSAVSRYFGQAKSRVSNPSGSGINKGGDIKDAEHHESGKHDVGKHTRIGFTNHSHITSDIFVYITSLIQDFCKKENIDTDMVMNALNDRSDTTSMELYKNRLQNRAKYYEDKVVDLEKLNEFIKKIEDNYSNIVTDITNDKTPTLV